MVEDVVCSFDLFPKLGVDDELKNGGWGIVRCVNFILLPLMKKHMRDIRYNIADLMKSLKHQVGR